MSQQASSGNTRSDLRAALIMLGAFAVIAAVFGVSALVYTLTKSDDADDGVLRAVIVDQLDDTQPNPDFRTTVTATLEDAGYVVDYVPADQVTVDYYRELPTHGYDIVLLRAHVAQAGSSEGDETLAEVFTSEPYDRNKHTYENENGYIGRVAYEEAIEDPDAPSFFGIGPAFVLASMNGKFHDSTIVMMGCSGLFSESMAEAFIRKGADMFVSWDDLVSASHTDAATELLVERMVVDGLSASAATEAAMAELGPDPFYDSKMLSYPPEG
jgi:hypothetical protein